MEYKICERHQNMEFRYSVRPALVLVKWCSAFVSFNTHTFSNKICKIVGKLK